MNKLVIIVLSLLLTTCQSNNKIAVNQTIVTEDITNFWEAYDKIQSTNDSLQQLEILQQLFINPATVGQKRMMAARNYTAEQYLNTILSHPKFWNSLRPNTENLRTYNQAIKEGVNNLKAIYPTLNPATIYYTMGTHRSPGTGVDSLVLIGTEYALGDTATVTEELREGIQNYYQINPTNHLQFLVVHEYVHTQQKAMVHRLLPLCLYEGIAEFVAHIATGKASPWKAMRYGPANNDKVRVQFEKDMFKNNVVYNWLWNSSNNQFQTRDLGYYIGYKIAALFYDKAKDKQAAIETLVELDYTDEAAVAKLVDGTQYLSKPIQKLRDDFEATRPQVVAIKEFSNGSKEVDPNTKQITLVFSEPMHKNSRGFDYGPLGEKHVLRVQSVIGYSEDRKSFSFEIRLEPNKQYQSVATDGFFTLDGRPLKPFLIDFKTGN